MIPSRISFENEIYQKIDVLVDDKGHKYIIGKGNTSSKEIEFDNIALEANPFHELITIFKKKKVDDNKICDWIQNYGFLNTSYGGSPHSRQFDYDWFISEAKAIVDLWIKYNETLHAKNDATSGILKKWLIPDRDSLKIFLDDSDHSSCSIYPSEDVRNGVYSSGSWTISYNKQIKNLGYREYAYSGFRYILHKITLRLHNISLDFKKVTVRDDMNLSLLSFVIENSIIVPPNLLTALYLYFFQMLHSNVRKCEVCDKPFYGRRSDALACCPAHSNTLKQRKQRMSKLNEYNQTVKVKSSGGTK